MPHRKAERRAAVIATAAVALSHVYLGIIGLFDLLSYTRPSIYPTLEFAQNDQFWGPAHLVIGALLLVGLHSPSMLDAAARLVRSSYDGVAEAWLCNISFTIMLIWGFFNWVAGVTATHPVALGAPGLAMTVAAGSHLLANAWVRIKGYDDKGR